SARDRHIGAGATNGDTGAAAGRLPSPGIDDAAADAIGRLRRNPEIASTQFGAGADFDSRRFVDVGALRVERNGEIAGHVIAGGPASSVDIPAGRQVIATRRDPEDPVLSAVIRTHGCNSGG